MGFIDTIKARAKAAQKTIVLPETEDRRTLEATEMILKEGIAKVVLVGNEEAIKKIKLLLKPEDAILIKASNGMKFSEIVKEISK